MNMGCLGRRNGIGTYRRRNDHFALALDVGFRHAVEFGTLLLAEGSKDRIPDYSSDTVSWPSASSKGKAGLLQYLSSTLTVSYGPIKS